MDADNGAAEWNLGVDEQAVDLGDSCRKARYRRWRRGIWNTASWFIAAVEKSREPALHIEAVETPVRASGKHLS